MPFSHHSHSGQFCTHAVNTQEEVVEHAISCGMTTFALTEHIPRDDQDFYPGEEDLDICKNGLYQLFDDYYAEAVRLREKYASQINILVGFETEWIRPSSLTIIESLLKKYRFDLFIGSVHHVHTIPIDYDDETYHKAREMSGGTDELLFEAYFDSQLDMLKAVKPPIVGHIDLICLKSDDPSRQWSEMPAVWKKIVRNLEFVAAYGGILEINTAALRKGLQDPYPKAEICQAFLQMGGRFTLSDDSHGIDHVGTNYRKALDWITTKTSIKELYYLERVNGPSTDVVDKTVARNIAVARLQSHGFWKNAPRCMRIQQ